MTKEAGWNVKGEKINGCLPKIITYHRKVKSKPLWNVTCVEFAMSKEALHDPVIKIVNVQKLLGTSFILLFSMMVIRMIHLRTLNWKCSGVMLWQNISKQKMESDTRTMNFYLSNPTQGKWWNNFTARKSKKFGYIGKQKLCIRCLSTKILIIK